MIVLHQKLRTNGVIVKLFGYKPYEVFVDQVPITGLGPHGLDCAISAQVPPTYSSCGAHQRPCDTGRGAQCVRSLRALAVSPPGVQRCHTQHAVRVFLW